MAHLPYKTIIPHPKPENSHFIVRMEGVSIPDVNWTTITLISAGES